MLVNTILIGVFFITLFIGIIQKRRKYYSGGKGGNAIVREKLPGVPGIPILGSIPWLLSPQWLRRTNTQILQEISRDWGSPCTIHVGVHECILMDDLDLAKPIMASEQWCNRYNDHPMFYERSFNQSIGLALANGDGWKEIRRFTTRTLRKYGFGKGNSMQTTIDFELDDVLGIFLDQVNKGKEGIATVDMHLIFNVSVLNIIWSLMAGGRFCREDRKLINLLEMVDSVSKSAPQGISAVFALPFLRYIPFITEHDSIIELHKKTQNLFREIIKEKRAKGVYSENPNDFIDAFLKEIEERKVSGVHREYYTDEQLIMTCTDLFFTGSDTTSTTLEFAFLYMMLNPAVQAKVQDEIALVVGNERQPSLDDRARMPYTEATMMEVLRYSSILPLTLRSPLEDNELLGYHVPKGTMTAINLHSIHFSEKLWEDPNVFRPERFLDEDNKIINAQKIMPFGYGKRACMGESLAKATFFTFFTTLMQKYTFSISPNHKKPTVKPISGFTQYPQPYHAVIKTRS